MIFYWFFMIFPDLLSIFHDFYCCSRFFTDCLSIFTDLLFISTLPLPGGQTWPWYIPKMILYLILYWIYPQNSFICFLCLFTLVLRNHKSWENAAVCTDSHDSPPSCTDGDCKGQMISFVHDRVKQQRDCEIDTLRISNQSTNILVTELKSRLQTTEVTEH